MKWRNTKTAPLPDKVTLFYFGDYKYVVGKVIMNDYHELLIMPEEDGPGCESFEAVKLWAYIKRPDWNDDYEN